MKRLVLAMVSVLSVVGIPDAWAFQPGERVTVGSTNQSGIVLEDTGKLVKVRFDSHSGYSEGVGVWFDKVEHKVTSGAGGTTTSPATDGKTDGTNSTGQGKRVKVGNQTGTILEEKGDIVKVRLDSHSGYGEGVGVWYTRAQLNGNDGAGNTQTSPQNGTPGGISTNNPGLAIGPGPGPGPVTHKPSPPTHATQEAPATEKGIGAPPDGIYTCNKISGRSYIHIGTIEIRGGTYKGFSSQQGSFHPYNLAASGDIVWTGGLSSFPTGWTLKPGKYVGPDSKGHPRIRVYYTSDRGAAEVIDATKEK
ncbi:hypothetical protein KA183_20205 [bacterium]|nr:hypothetical protein [bacterium]QQR57390.1 MAG: hypothetical protein IPG59_20815 [Candidatus Melainabacteria bacterium]